MGLPSRGGLLQQRHQVASGDAIAVVVAQEGHLPQQLQGLWVGLKVEAGGVVRREQQARQTPRSALRRMAMPARSGSRDPVRSRRRSRSASRVPGDNGRVRARGSACCEPRPPSIGSVARSGSPRWDMISRSCSWRLRTSCQTGQASTFALTLSTQRLSVSHSQMESGQARTASSLLGYITRPTTPWSRTFPAYRRLEDCRVLCRWRDGPSRTSIADQ